MVSHLFLGAEVSGEVVDPAFDPNIIIPETQVTQPSMPPPSELLESQENKSDEEEDENEDKESERLTQQFLSSPKIPSTDSEKKRKKIKIPKKNQRPSKLL